MMPRKACLPLLVVIGIFVFAAGSAHATLSYVRPSGNGGDCDLTMPTVNCVSVLPGGILEVGDGTKIIQYQIVGVGGVVDETTVNFTFNGAAPASTFQVLACAYEAPVGTVVSPGIYNSNPTRISTSCTQLGDYCPDVFTTGCNPDKNHPFQSPANFVTNDNCTITDTLCLTFSSGTGFPSTWFFVEDVQTITNDCSTDPLTNVVTCQTNTDGPTVSFITETTPGSGGGTTPAPEPASMTLLAAGLVGLGALRRKRAA